MSRSLKIKKECISEVKQSLKYRRYRSQRHLAEDADLSLATVSKFLNAKVVDFAVFVELCEFLSLDWEAIADLGPSFVESEITQTKESPTEVKSTRIDWGDAPETSRFYGRSDTLDSIKAWILSEKCRFVAILGQGGIGKTSLAVRLVTRIQDEFDFVIWRSLRNPIPVDDMLIDLIEFLSNQHETKKPETLDKAVITLLGYLQKHRCLIVLDNFESILQSSDRTGCYCSDHEGYGQLLRSIGETAHQSCLILTSRESPKGLAVQQGQHLPVRQLKLDGLDVQEGRNLFLDKGKFQGAAKEWNQVIQHYEGNPLALKIVATVVEESFNSDISELIKLFNQNLLIFDDISDLLERQFQRLTTLEQQVMYWLAINRNFVSVNNLRSDMIGPASTSDILEVLKSLRRRSLISQSAQGYSQQPAIMEYVINRLNSRIVEDIKTIKFEYLNDYSLCKAQSEDYIREAQLLFAVKPVVEQLLQYFGSEQSLKKHLIKILDSLRQNSTLKPGYGAGNILTVLCQLSLSLARLDFSDLPVWQTDLRNISLSQVDFSRADLSKSIFSEVFGALFAVAFSPDGNVLATSGEREIRLWTFPELLPIAQFQTHSLWSYGLAFHPNGSLLACPDGDAKTVSLWRTEDGHLERVFQHNSRTYKIAFSPDGKLLACGDQKGSISLWDIETGERVNQLGKNLGSIWAVDFSPDGNIIASGSDDNTVRLWDIKTGQCLRCWQDVDSIRAVTFHPHVPLLAGGGYDCQVKIWHVETGELVQQLSGHSYLVRSVMFSPDGQLIVSASQDQSIRIWQVETGMCLKTLQGHSSSVWEVAFSSDQKTLASVSDDHALRIWDLQTGRCLRQKQGHTYQVWGVEFSGNSHWLASAFSDHTVKLWDVITGECFNIFHGHRQIVFSVAISPNEEIIASGSQNIRLWHRHKPDCFRILKGHTNWVWSLTFSPDGQRLWSSSSDQTIKLWDIATGKCLKTLQGHSTIVWQVAFISDNKTLISADDNGLLKFWDIASSECLHTLEAHKMGVASIVVSSDGKRLITASYDTTIKLWDLTTLKCLHTFSGHKLAVKSLALSPDQTILLSGSYDSTMKLWDLEKFQETITIEGHSKPIMSVSYSQDGRFFASGSDDETIKVWNAPTGEHFKTLKPTRLYEGMKISEVKGLTASQISTLQALGVIL
ncbi:MAG: NB-ARC domain-containing protein [Cyanobacteria bacterium P01_B01_bin.77]